MGHWINLDGLWKNLNAQLTILDTWWEKGMGMSGQLWVDSGIQKHSDLDQPDGEHHKTAWTWRG